MKPSFYLKHFTNPTTKERYSVEYLRIPHQEFDGPATDESRKEYKSEYEAFKPPPVAVVKKKGLLR